MSAATDSDYVMMSESQCIVGQDLHHNSINYDNKQFAETFLDRHTCAGVFCKPAQIKNKSLSDQLTQCVL